MNSIGPIFVSPQSAAARPKKKAEAAVVPDETRTRIAALEAEIQQCYNHYMYCEAADFQSAEEREGSRKASQRMGEIAVELAQLRGASVLNRENVKVQVDVILDRQPLARLGSRAFKAVYPHARFSGYGVDNPAGRLHDAVRHGFLTQEQVDAKVLSSGTRRKATAAKDDDVVRQAAARALIDAIPREHEGLFPDLKAFLAFPGQPGLADAVKSLLAEGLVSLKLEDVNRARRCVYVPGQLGGEVQKFRQGKDAQWALRAMANLMDQPGLPITPEEKEQALTCAAQSLMEQDKKSKDEWSRRRFEEEKARWQTRGLTEEHFKVAILGGAQPVQASSIGETPDWIVVGSSRLRKQS